MQNKNWFFKIFSKMTSAWCHQVWGMITIIWKYFVVNFERNSQDCSKTKFHLKKWKISKKTSFFEKTKKSLIKMQNKNWFFKIFSKIISAWCHKVWWLITSIWKYFVIYFEPNSQDWPNTKFHLKKWKICKKTSFFDKKKTSLIQMQNKN